MRKKLVVPGSLGGTVVILAVALGLSLAAPSPATAQAHDLPDIPVEQRWERAALHTTLFSAVMLRQAAAAGQDPAAFAREMVELVGPGWDGIASPAAMAGAIRRNFALWPGSEFRIDDAGDDHVRFRYSHADDGDWMVVTIDRR